jgi:hypothetical protein
LHVQFLWSLCFNCHKRRQLNPSRRRRKKRKKKKKKKKKKKRPIHE